MEWWPVSSNSLVLSLNTFGSHPETEQDLLLSLSPPDEAVTAGDYAQHPRKNVESCLQYVQLCFIEKDYVKI